MSILPPDDNIEEISKKVYGWTTTSLKPEYLKILEHLSEFHDKQRSQMLHAIIIMVSITPPVEREAMLALAEKFIDEISNGMEIDFDAELLIPDDSGERIFKNASK